MTICEHEYYYDNEEVQCLLCGNYWGIGDMIDQASRVPNLIRKREELLSVIRQCLPYVHDFVGIASGARILEQEINELLDEQIRNAKSGLTQRAPDADTESAEEVAE